MARALFRRRCSAGAFAGRVAARYWRIFIIANNGDGGHSSLGEVQLRAGPGGADLTWPAMTVTQSSNYTGMPGSMTVDNTTATTWATAVGAYANSWVAYDFGAAVTLAEVVLTSEAHATYGQTRAPKDFEIQCSDNGSVWTTVASFGGVTGWGNAATKTFSLPALGGDPYWGLGVKSLMHFDGADGATTTTCAKGKVLTLSGNARLRTAQKKFGVSSLYLDGSGDYGTIAHHNDFNIGGGDFSIRFQAMLNAMPGGGTYAFFVCKDNTSGTRGWRFWVDGATQKLGFTITAGTTITCPNTHPVGVMQEIEATRVGNLMYLFVDGVMQGAPMDVTGISEAAHTNPVTFGATLAGASPYNITYANAYIDEFQFTKGYGRNTASYVPSSQPFLEY